MKKMLKIGALSLALIASLLLLSGDKTNAASGSVSLRINTGTSSCAYVSTFYIGSGTASFNSFYITGSFPTTVFSCTDYEGSAGWWSMTLQATTPLTGSNGQTIAASNVSMKVQPAGVTAWTCATGAAAITMTAIDTTKVLIARTAVAWPICTITATGITIQANIPASQAVGIYTGTLMLVAPRNN